MTATATTRGVTVARTAFLDGLKAVALVASNREKALPISRCVLIGPDGDGLRFTGTDFNRTVSLVVPAEGVEDFPARAIPCHRLVAIFEQLPSGSVSLAPHGAGLRVTAGRSRFDVVGMAADEFPDGLRATGKATSLTIDAPALVAAMTRCASVVSHEPSRPTLQCVHVQGEKNKPLVIQGCDGSIATREWVERASGPALDILVPAPTVSIIAKLFADAELLTVELNDQRASFTADTSVRVTTQLGNGPYPETSQFYKLALPHEASVDRAALLAVVKRVASLSNDLRFLIRTEWAADAVTVSGIGDDAAGIAEDVVPCRFKGEESVRVAFAPRYILASLALRTGETLTVGFKNAESVMTFRDDTSAVVQGIAMPRRELGSK